ncbi:hypothetical protein KSC_030160 [Ktedonobacter sp. SOSP1-52]|uniref:hypothetical protein n=1 Tax=Ktedonobacter sp. SOSP1-52 TaxID=2778366 RepID=UPI001A1D9FCE|nr:hypothetical protein [Ktedonobacter sp. SOSP1-52]GHO64124.1 hypothetical protein KSC_030160 [Ktedonobacter sp. SOSP1-52]
MNTMTGENHIWIHLALPDERLYTVTPEKALAFVAWLSEQIGDLPLALEAWFNQAKAPSDYAPLGLYVRADYSPADGHYYSVDYGLDVPGDHLLE